MKNKIVNLEKKIKELEIELNKEKARNKDLVAEIKGIKNTDTQKIIVDLIKENKELKKKLSRYPFELLDKEYMMSVILTSSEQKLHSSFICKNTTKFTRLEEQIYTSYPEYKETDNFFTSNGNIIDKYKTMEENNINNNDVIVLTAREI